MKVILTTHIKGVGQKGDIKEVSDGYFQNFLAPRKWAVQATSGQVNQVTAQKAKAVEKLENMKESALAVKEKIDGKTITLNEKASESGKLYATLHGKDVSIAIQKELNVQIPEKQIHMESVKNTGTFTVDIELYKGIKASLTLHVLAS